ncbi:MAG TPA: transcriptional regulator [Nitrospirota bacterium]|nr:transcriptional regulator [Nitrospirota bacterium]
MWFFLDRLLKYMTGLPGGGAEKPRKARSVEGDEMVQDPECKVYIPVSRAVEKNVGGKTVHFCSEECASKYIKGVE